MIHYSSAVRDLSDTLTVERRPYSLCKLQNITVYFTSDPQTPTNVVLLDLS